MISVIMPVYNSIQYLDDAIQSVLNQEYKDFELIIIDDGSNDGSEVICDSYSQRDNRVIVVHQQNGGICNARNRALEIAQGDYIAFCDNDDIMMPNCLSEAIGMCQEFEVDVVRFYRAHWYIGRKKHLCPDPDPWKNKEIISITDWQSYMYVREYSSAPWAGIYRRDFLKKNRICFDENIRFGYEDALFVSKCCGEARTVAVMPVTLYEWIQRQGNSTSRKNGENIFSNRIDAINKTKVYEDNLAERLGRTSEQKTARYFMFLTSVLSECGLVEPNKRRNELVRNNPVIQELINQVQKENNKYIISNGLKDKIQYWLVKKEYYRLYFLFMNLRFKFRWR